MFLCSFSVIFLIMSPSTPRRTVSFAPDPEHIPPSQHHQQPPQVPFPQANDTANTSNPEIPPQQAPQIPYFPPTPSKPSMSERQFGVKTVREAKRVLEEELEGVIHDFEPGRIEVLLERAASLEECKKYLRSRS